ncbi:hypothetical protein SAG0066_00780 [Streptococcus agalactiae CCUG 38383]|nr:hypothetical protein SAG0066_00780 [Streptococcus agalactiae CCUG 38383]
MIKNNIKQVLQVHGNSYSDTVSGDVHQALKYKLMFSKDPVRNSKDKTLVEATIVGIYKGKTVQKSNYP